MRIVWHTQPDYAHWSSHFFEGGAIVTGKCTQLTIAITSGTLHHFKNGVQTMQQAERAVNFWFVSRALVTFWGQYRPVHYYQSQTKSKKLSDKFVWGTRRQFGGQLLAPCRQFWGSIAPCTLSAILAFEDCRTMHNMYDVDPTFFVQLSI